MHDHCCYLNSYKLLLSILSLIHGIEEDIKIIQHIFTVSYYFIECVYHYLQKGTDHISTVQWECHSLLFLVFISSTTVTTSSRDIITLYPTSVISYLIFFFTHRLVKLLIICWASVHVVINYFNKWNLSLSVLHFFYSFLMSSAFRIFILTCIS